MAEKKEKRYVSDNAQLMAEWDWEKNNKIGIYPSTITLGSDKKVWWLCNAGHSYNASIANRANLNRGCPYCSNKKVLVGYNDLATINPSLAAEWHPTRNNTLSPSGVLSGTSEKVWWKCAQGHEWEASVINRHKHGSNCPFCSHLVAIPGNTDLATQYPHVAKEWHPTKNGTLSPSLVLPGSDKVVWWMCEQGHEWQAPVKRCLKSRGCPYCSGRKPIKGKNDIQSQNPFLANEWNQRKNRVSASEVSIRSGIKYWWTCSKCGFEWQATPHNRTNGALSTGCPQCAQESQTSYPEQVIYYYISKHYPDAVNRYSDAFFGRMELDIYIPMLKIGIEYDGVAWHSADEIKEREQQKYLVCQEQGVFLIRIRENSNENFTAACDQLININYHPCNQDLYQTLMLLSKFIPMEDDFLVDRDEQDIRAKYVARFRENSLENLRPDIAANWNHKKNKSISPNMVTLGSHYKAWWICDQGHEWQTPVSSMVKNRNKFPNSTGCPYCAGQRVISGETDINTLAPHLVQEWNYSRNQDMLPEQTAAQSNKKAWWICQYEHEWEATISSRYRGLGCPYCSGRRILPGYNDFATKYPSLMTEWDFEKNISIEPTKVGAADKTKVWWICEKSHQYEASISNRSNGQKCPYCTGKKVFSGTNDLATLNPEILGEWDYEKKRY